MGVENEINAISAFSQVEVEFEAELGKNFTRFYNPRPKNATKV